MTTQSTQIGKFPKIWKIDRVDSVFEIQQGKQVSQVNRIGNNQRSFLRTKNVFWGRIELSELDQMNFTETEELRLTLKSNDLLMCEGGDIGRTALWDRDIQRCYYQNHLHRLRTINKQAHAQFFAYWFWYAFVNTTIYSGRANVTTIPNLSRSRLAELPVVIPPLTEQKKIAHILSTVQRAIQAQEQIIQTTTELFKAMLHQLMTAQIRVANGMRVNANSKPHHGAGDWKTCAVSDSFVKSKVGRKNQIPARNISKAGSIPVVDQGQDFIAGYCDDESRIIDFDLPLIIFGDHTRCFKYVDFPFILGADGTKILVPNKNLYDSKFYYFALLALQLPSRGYNRHFKLLKERTIPIPPLPEQKKITHILATIQQKTHTAQSKKSKLETLFRTLLHELMTAKTRVSSVDLIST